jgi:two-component system chemotaxis response regulator CheY
MTDPALATVVIIDDHPEHLDYLAMLLRRAGYVVAAFEKAQAALDFVARSPVDLVITDVFMPDLDGIEVLMALRRSFPDLPVIAVSGVGPRSQPLFLGVMRHMGARATFAKPLDEIALLATMARLVGSAEGQDESRSEMNPPAAAP